MNNEVVPRSHYPQHFQLNCTRLCCWNATNLWKKSRGKSMAWEVVKASAFAVLPRVYLPGTRSYKTWTSSVRNRKRKEKSAY